MGTNFYWNPKLVHQVFDIDNVDEDDPRVHIGKRSAIGGYCRRCGITRSGHTRYVHYSTDASIGNTDPNAINAYIDRDTCPNCNLPWENNATSFTFTMMGHLVTVSNLYNIEIAQRNKDPLIPPLEIVIDEYGKPYTAVEFLDNVLRQCPIQFQDYGRWS